MIKRVYASFVSSLVLLIPAAHCQSVQPRIAAATFALMLALTPSPTQRPSPNVQASKDEAEIQACTLTMGTITRMMQATEELFLLPDAEHRKDDAGDSKAEQSLDRRVAGLAKRPQTVAVLGKYGFTPRTYTVAFYALLTGIATAGLDAGASLENTVTKVHVNPANIALVRAHKKEIDELMNRYVYPYW